MGIKFKSVLLLNNVKQARVSFWDMKRQVVPPFEA
jgi:hypothetical protein